MKNIDANLNTIAWHPDAQTIPEVLAQTYLS